MSAKSFSPDDFTYDPDNTGEIDLPPEPKNVVKMQPSAPPPRYPKDHPITPDLAPPPHSPPSEKTVLSCWWRMPETRAEIEMKGVGVDSFHIPANRIIWQAIQEYPTADLPAMAQILNDRGELDRIGGPATLSDVYGYAVSVTSLPLHLKILIQKTIARAALFKARKLIDAISSEPEDVESIIAEASSELAKTSRIGVSVDGIKTTNEILGFDIENDQTSLIGYQGRFLGEAGSWIIAGPSGIGKSTFTTSFILHAASGRPWHGISFRRPLRTLVVQAENDEGDLREMLEGAIRAVGLPMDKIKLAASNIKWRRMSTLTGEDFVRWLEAAIVETKAELVHIDPLLAYVGDDISLQSVASHFFRNLIQPVLDRTRAIMTAVHHTGKTSTDSKSRENWSESDFAYLGFGSSELTNWARAVGVLVPWGKDTGIFKFLIAKRGGRAGMQNAFTKEKTSSILLQHAETGMGWVQAQEPEKVDLPRNSGAKTRVTGEQILGVVGKFDAAIRKDILISQVSEKFVISNKTAREKVENMINTGAIVIESQEKRQEGGHPIVWLRKGAEK